MGTAQMVLRNVYFAPKYQVFRIVEIRKMLLVTYLFYVLLSQLKRVFSCLDSDYFNQLNVLN